MKLGLKGTFTLTVRRADGSVKQTLQFDNLITNGGMDRIAGPAGTTYTSHDLYNRLLLSTNATTPAVTDTVMGGTTISTSSTSATYPNSEVSSGSPNYVITWQNGWSFAIGAATGTWSSIGMDISGGPLFCKTLIKSAGTPTTLVILATESLDIRYDLTITPVLTDSSGSVTINGTSIGWTARVWSVNDAFGVTNRNKSLGADKYGYKGSLHGGGTIALGATTGGSLSNNTSPPQSGFTQSFASGGNRDPNNSSFGTYTSGSYSRTITHSWGAAYVAGGGVVSVNGCTVRPGGICPPYQMIFSPAIPKSVSEELSLTFTVTWVRM